MNKFLFLRLSLLKPKNFLLLGVVEILFRRKKPFTKIKINEMKKRKEKSICETGSRRVDRNREGGIGEDEDFEKDEHFEKRW